MNGLTLNIKIIYLLLSLMIIQACNNQDSTKSAADEQDSDIIKREVILSPGTQDILNRLPTPVEITRIISEAKAPYIFSLTNPPANVNRYFTQKTKALNLGIYSIDLAYSSIYQRITETDQFLYCTGKLADYLGIGGVYDKSLPEKIKATSGNRDSLIMMIEKVFGKTSDFLRRNNRNQVAILVAAGAYVEGLHLAASLCQLIPDNSQIAAIVFRQKESLGKIQRILGEYGSDITIRPVADELATFGPIFTGYGLDEGKSLPAEKVTGILKIIEQVRSSMIR